MNNKSVKNIFFVILILFSSLSFAEVNKSEASKQETIDKKEETKDKKQSVIQ